MISEINNNDKTVIYELPIPLSASAAAPPPKSSADDKSTSRSVTPSIEVPSSSPAPKPKLPPFIIPVYHTIHEEPLRTSSSSSFGAYRRGGIGNNTRFDEGKLFGIPTFVLLEQEDEDGEPVGITQERIYEAVLGQYRRWTERADHLYDWRAGDEIETADPILGSSVGKPGEVTANGHLNESSTADSLATAVASPGAADAEGSDEAMKVDYEPPSGPPPASPQPIYVGPKLNLFKVALRESPSYIAKTHLGSAALTMSVNYDNTRAISWADRTITPEPEEGEAEEGDIADESKLALSSDFVPIDVDAPPELEQVPKDDVEDVVDIEVDTITTTITTKSASAPHLIQLKPSDVLRCEWDPHLLEYYFGPQGKGDGALWERFTTHLDPSLPTVAQRQAVIKKTITLEDCLEEFCREERLGEDDLWYCPHCKKHQQATKQFQLWKVPDVLVVHLKRFSNSRLLRDKIDAMVDFPVNGLDLSSRVGEKLFKDELETELGDTVERTDVENIPQEEIYDLFAVDEHMGGMGGGHYRAHALNADDNQWYYYDDAHVSKARAEDAVVSLSFRSRDVPRVPLN